MEKKRSIDEEEDPSLKKNKKLRSDSQSETFDRSEGQTSSADHSSLSSHTDAMTLPCKDNLAPFSMPIGQKPGCSDRSSDINIPVSSSSDVSSLRCVSYSMTDPIKKLADAESPSTACEKSFEVEENNPPDEEEETSLDDLDMENLLDEIEEVEEEETSDEDSISSDEEE